MAHQTQINKYGTKTTHLVYGVAADTVRNITNNPATEQEDGAMKVAVDNKRERAALLEAVRKADDAEQAARELEAAGNPVDITGIPGLALAGEAGNGKRRYLTNLERAELYGLNHGRAWTCGEIDIQTKGALPEWEGDLICYVYED